jgi:HTH-type transcriptional regulator, transcriptional repressor of NAD biosynthesis genes
MTQGTHGLTLGKFAPLHRGHQYLIETALREMEAVTVIIYDSPEVTDIPLNVRAGWIRELYPTVHVIEAWDGPPDVGDTPEIKQKQEDYILNTLQIHGITHFYSSEFYGEHMSRALGAVNREVDRDRGAVPISGSTIRSDTYRYRHFLDPRVYRDFITHVVFVGAPSTGKTTLAERMAQEFGTVWMPEYGREYWEAHQENRRLSEDQLVEIAEGHLERENRLLYEANRYLFTDTNALTTYVFSLYYHNHAAPRLVDLANKAFHRYDLVFLCGDDIPYDDTWDRSGEVNRQVFQRRVVSDLIERKIPYIELRGDLDERVRTVKRVLSRCRKFAGWVENFKAVFGQGNRNV